MRFFGSEFVCWLTCAVYMPGALQHPGAIVRSWYLGLLNSTKDEVKPLSMFVTKLRQFRKTCPCAWFSRDASMHFFGTRSVAKPTHQEHAFSITSGRVEPLRSGGAKRGIP